MLGESRSNPTSVKPMPTDEGERARALVGIEADQRLQKRSGQLERQGDQPDLSEIEAERLFRIG